jgi:hypothetical protein
VVGARSHTAVPSWHGLGMCGVKAADVIRAITGYWEASVRRAFKYYMYATIAKISRSAKKLKMKMMSLKLFTTIAV